MGLYRVGELELKCILLGYLIALKLPSLPTQSCINVAFFVQNNQLYEEEISVCVVA